MSRQQYGQRVNVPAPVGLVDGQPVRAIQTPTYETEAREWAVQIIPEKLPAVGIVLATVRYGVGGVQVVKKFKVPTLTMVKVNLVATYVQVDLYIPAVAVAAPGDASIVVTALEGHMPGADGYAWTACTPVDGTDNGELFPGPCVVGQIHFTIETAGPIGPGAPAWLQLIDSPTAPVGGEFPIKLGVSDAVFGVGDGDSMSDELAPGQIAVNHALWAVLSSTAGVYTALGAGATMHCDGKVGQ